MVELEPLQDAQLASLLAQVEHFQKGVQAYHSDQPARQSHVLESVALLQALFSSKTALVTARKTHALWRQSLRQSWVESVARISASRIKMHIGRHVDGSLMLVLD